MTRVSERRGVSRIFVRPLCREAGARLTDPDRERLQLTGAPKTMLNAEQMRSLPLKIGHADARTIGVIMPERK
jgi:hypothetical protein